MLREQTKQLRPIARRSRPRGVALFLVIAAVAIATILGLVMLSTATLANSAGGNQFKLVSNQYLGESGINLAAYYLQNPPSGDPQVYWTGTGGPIAIGSSGTVDVSVTPALDSSGNAIPWTYEVSCAVVAGTAAPVSRVYQARLQVQTSYMTTWAGAFNNDLSLGGTASYTINGDLYVAGQLMTPTLPIGITIAGTSSATNFVNSLGMTTNFPSPQVKLSAPATRQAPTINDVNLYRSYLYNGVPATATVLTGSTLSGTLPSADSHTNPAQVFYYDAGSIPFTLGDNAVINGTLVVANGDLWIRGNGIIINPQPGYPALVVTHNLDMAMPGLIAPPNTLTANGVVFVGNQITQSGILPQFLVNYSVLNVNGSLLSGVSGTSPFASGYKIVTNLTYVANNAKAPDLTSNPALRHPTGVSILRWGPP